MWEKKKIDKIIKTGEILQLLCFTYANIIVQLCCSFKYFASEIKKKKKMISLLQELITTFSIKKTFK